MNHLRTFAAFFMVLMIVFMVHTNSDLWIVHPDRMVLKEKSSTLQHVFWSAMLSSVYALLGTGVSALLSRICRRRPEN